MKPFALTLLSTAVYADIGEIFNYQFDKYFSKVAGRPTKPMLGQYTYERGIYFIGGSKDYGVNIVASGDLNADYKTPFVNNLAQTFYTFSIIPELTVGG